MWECVEGGGVAKLLFGRSPQVSPWKWSEIMVGGRQVHTLTGQPSPDSGDVRCVALSPDGKHVVSGSSDKLVKISDTETGALVSRFEGVL